MSKVNFVVGETFPLPIVARGDGGLFQVDANGAMFILKLSRTDAIAHEAFRTGEIELALVETEGILLLLYKIDGIFKEGWGDAPLAIHLLPPERRPNEISLNDKRLHLYLVDSRLDILLAQRQVDLNDGAEGESFWQKISSFALQKTANPDEHADFSRKLGKLYLNYPPEKLAEIADVKFKINSTLPKWQK